MNRIFSSSIFFSGLFVCVLFCTSCSKELYEERRESAEKTTAAAGELLMATSELRNEINKKVEENPNSSSEDFIDMVDKKEQEIQYVQKRVLDLKPKTTLDINQKRKFDKIRQYQQRLSSLSHEVSAIYKSFEKELDKKLQSDVYFHTGSANISNTGRLELKEFVYKEIQQIIKEWDQEEMYIDKPKKVKINVVGYADLQGSQNKSVRQKNNLQLSEKRAKEVKDIIESYLNELNSTYKLQIIIDHQGKGEELPPGVTDSHAVNNPDRRICIVSGYVIPVF
ncbi:MAG: OmpA family protein [Bacteroidetes bacterium]|jgi:outer membrane protein OmpA-like peptidoglycan-associated protein|nr:OmpA family protein [Bacteroidota bacterium]